MNHAVFVLFALAHGCCTVSAFVSFSTNHRHVVRSEVLLKFTEDAITSSTSATSNSTRTARARNEAGRSQELSKLPMRQQVLKIQNRLQEIRDLSAHGETLTQEYCDSTLGLCVAADDWESVLDVLAIMKAHNLSQQHSSYQACLQSSFEMGNAASAEEILNAMERALVKPCPADIGLVAAAMCRNNKQESGWWKKALDLLMKEPSPEVPVDAYDAVLACMVEEHKWKEAIRFLREMERGSSGVSNRIHPKPTLATYREVIECCVASDQAEQAVQVLYSMTDRKIKPTVYTFELVISALARKLHWRRALQLLDLMGDLQVQKTVLTYNTVIGACARAKEVAMAKNLLTRMRKEGIQPTIVTYNSLLSACAGSRRWKDAMHLLDQLNRDPNTVPDIYSYTNVCRACAKCGKIDKALTLYEVVKHKNLKVDSYFYAAVIEACAKAKLWRKALDLLGEMEMQGIPPTDVIYSVTITACGNAGRWEKSLELLDLMRDKGMRINLITYNSAIAALAKAAKQKSKMRFSKIRDQNDEKLWIRAIEILGQMKSDGVQPDGFSFSSAISCCGAEGVWKEAVHLLEIMQKGGPRTKPNKIAYTAAITACGRSGEYEHALRLFCNMREEGLSVDRVAYNAVFNALRIAEKPDLAYDLWKEMCGSKQISIKVDKGATPDVVTITDLIAALSSSSGQEARLRVDEVFAEAVRREIFLANTLDSIWEVDLSGMTFAVARAACRFVLERARDTGNGSSEIHDLTFITGVGAGLTSGISRPRKAGSSEQEEDRMSLRDYVRKVLLEDFNPPVQSVVPKRAQGTVQIDKSDLEEWVRTGTLDIVH